MFHAVIEGRKSMTRIIIKPQPNISYCTKCKKDIGICVCEFKNDSHANRCTKTLTLDMLKPRYKVGETCFIKEPYELSYDEEGNEIVRYLDGEVRIFKK